MGVILSGSWPLAAQLSLLFLELSITMLRSDGLVSNPWPLILMMLIGGSEVVSFTYFIIVYKPVCLSIPLANFLRLSFPSRRSQSICRLAGFVFSKGIFLYKRFFKRMSSTD